MGILSEVREKGSLSWRTLWKPDYSMLLITYFGYRPMRLIYLTCTALNVLPNDLRILQSLG